MTCLPSPPASHLHRLWPEARHGEGGSGVSWGPAQTQTPRKERERRFAAPAEPSALVPPGLVEGSQQRNHESTSGFLLIKRAHCVSTLLRGLPRAQGSHSSGQSRALSSGLL